MQLDKSVHDHPIHFVSRQLISIEKKYTMTKQGLVVIFFLEKFHHYLLGTRPKL